MGCASSVPASDVPTGSGGTVQAFSPASFALCSVKPDGKRSFEEMANKDKNGTSEVLNAKWGLDRATPFSIRYWTSNSFPKAGDMTPAERASIDIGENDNFTLILGSYYPLGVPVASQKALGSTAVICPLVKAVDIHVTVDGSAACDGHICCGDATLDRSSSIKHAEDKVAASGEEEALRSMLETGPPGVKPWATVVGKEFNEEFFVHLPLIVQGNIDDATLPESEEYGGALVSKFSSLLASVGPGSHELSVRFAPRGVIGGGEVIAGKGGFKGGGSSGIGLSIEDYYNDDACVKALIDGALRGQHPAADIESLRTTFTINIPPLLCKGGGGERKAPEFLHFFSGDLTEHCNIALSIAASGPPREAISTLLGTSFGSPAHIIIPSSDLAGGITPMNTQDGREAGTRFYAVALFFSADPDNDDELGAMVKFVCAKYTRRHRKAVSSPKWESEGTFGNARDKCTGFPIRNNQIRAAKERDEGTYQVE